MGNDRHDDFNPLDFATDYSGLSDYQFDPSQFSGRSSTDIAAGWQAAAKDAGVDLATPADTTTKPLSTDSTPGATPKLTAASPEPADMKAVEDSFSPSREGYHQYQSGPNLVCPANLQCTPQEMADQMSRFAVPGQNPDDPAKSGHVYSVYAPGTGTFVGRVQTTISQDGLTSQNLTRPGHLLYNGEITRTASQNADGSWSVTAIGKGQQCFAWNGDG